MHKIQEEINIRLISYNEHNLQAVSALPPIIKKRMIEKMTSREMGEMKLAKEDTSGFKPLSAGFNVKYARIFSDNLIHIFVESSTESSYVTTTTTFAHENPKMPIRISVANGTLDLDPETNILSRPIPSTDKDITIEYILINY